jgi:hypothetical protein
MLLALSLFALPIPFTDAVPTKDAVLDIKVRRVLNTTSLTGTTNNNAAVESSSSGALEDLTPINHKYLIHQNDEIVLDISVMNPSSQKIISTESWLSYDPKKLSGIKIDSTDSKFDMITPGENEFVPDQSVVRIGRGSTTGGIDDTSLKVASVYFKVLSATPGDTTAITFYDYQSNELGRTNVNIISGGLPFNILTSQAPTPVQFVLNSSSVPVDTGTTTTSSSSSPSTSSSSSSGNSLPPVVEPYSGSGAVYPTYSGLLPIPQHIQATTDSSSITLQWDPITDPNVQFTYIYYTTHQNTYLHRKKVYGNSYTFDNLRTGDRYYFVLTSANSMMESGYSPELAITVGQSGSVQVSSQLSNEAIASLNKISKTAGAGPKETMLLMMVFLSCLVYPFYKILKRILVHA